MTRSAPAVALILACAATLSAGCGGSSSSPGGSSAKRRVAARRVVQAMMPTLADYPGYAREGRTLNGSCPGTRDDAGTPARAKGHTVALVAGSVTVTGGAAVWSTPARAHTEYELAVAPKVLQCFATFLRTSLKAGATAGLVTTHVSPLDVGDEGSEVHVVVPLRYRGHAFTIYLDAAFYRISNATGSLSIVAWPREYSPGLFHAELDRLAERGRAALRAT